MAEFNVNTFLNQLPPNAIPNGLSTNQLSALTLSLMNQISQGKQGAQQQLAELLGPDLAQQILEGYQTGQMPTDKPALPPAPPAPTTTPGSPTPIPGTNYNNITELPGPTSTPNIPLTGGIAGKGGTAEVVGNPNADIAAILKEGVGQQKQSLDTLNLQNSARQSYLNDLSGILQKQQAAQLTDALPGVYEDLNTRGLLRSSALGDRLATAQKSLAAETSSELAKQGLADQETYTTGLGDITKNLQGFQDQALNRNLNMEDYNNQLRGSQLLGQVIQPTNSNNSGKDTSLATAAITSAPKVAAAGK